MQYWGYAFFAFSLGAFVAAAYLMKGGGPSKSSW